VPFEIIFLFSLIYEGIVEVICDTEEMNAIEIIDIAGRLLYHQPQSASRNLISVSNLPPAVYVIKVSFKRNSQST
jgi:hypothetical protein